MVVVLVIVTAMRPTEANWRLGVGGGSEEEALGRLGEALGRLGIGCGGCLGALWQAYRAPRDPQEDPKGPPRGAQQDPAPGGPKRPLREA